MHFAPVQGHTDAPYRHFHAQVYGGNLTYYTPFIRLEHGQLRRRDLTDFTSDLNHNLTLIPQIIFRDEEELFTLARLLHESGARRIDLNMGCPFPLQTGHGRGAATVANDTLGVAVTRLTHDMPDINFSLKMRLGLSDPDEWHTLLPHLNNARLMHVTVHPRIAKQQYSGDLYLDRFQQLLDSCEHPVIYNGELRSPENVVQIYRQFPKISDVMIGRGLLGRPSLSAEIAEGREWTSDERHTKLLTFHRLLFTHYQQTLCGDTQILTKIQPFWEYTEDEIGRKAWKALRKANTLPKYRTALAQLS
ncbi:MAG: tRNA-dihydrouridine synthase family protein [Muribaculaceae bacterium]|nr:tRNA-dihydrouridine synthase family protein [Muribaculaceae bacterium]